MADEMGVFETLYNCRAMRRLKPDPVPEELLLKLVDAANQAPTGSNAQGARWIVVRDPEQRAQLAALNKTAVEAYVAPGGSTVALTGETQIVSGVTWWRLTDGNWVQGQFLKFG